MINDQGQPPSRERGADAQFQFGESREGFEHQRFGVDVAGEAQGVEQDGFGAGVVAEMEIGLAEIDEGLGDVLAFEVFAEGFETLFEMAFRFVGLTRRESRESEIAIRRAHAPAILRALA